MGASPSCMMMPLIRWPVSSQISSIGASLGSLQPCNFSKSLWLTKSSEREMVTLSSVSLSRCSWIHSELLAGDCAMCAFAFCRVRANPVSVFAFATSSLHSIPDQPLWCKVAHCKHEGPTATTPFFLVVIVVAQGTSCQQQHSQARLSLLQNSRCLLSAERTSSKTTAQRSGKRGDLGRVVLGVFWAAGAL